MKKLINNYKNAGVNIITGNEASKILFEASRKTWSNRPEFSFELELIQNSFSGIRFIDLAHFSNAILGMNFDGIGTKIEIAERVSNHRTIAFDLFAMVCDDAAISGGEPILLGSIIDFNKISLKVVKQLAEGMVNAAKISNVAVINGEIAELGARVNGYGDSAYNWGASTIWIGRRERILRHRSINQKFEIVGIKEFGLRSNGLSLIRKVFLQAYGENWHNEKFENKTIGEKVLEPSIIYTPLIVTLTGGYFRFPKAKIYGIAHITGGGIPNKLGHVLKDSGYGAMLDNLFKPCSIINNCQSLASISDYESYKTWNMGNGLLIITPEPEKVIKIATGLKYIAKVVGEIQKDKKIIIKSEGFNKHKEKILIYSIN